MKQNRRYFSLEELLTQGLFYCILLHVTLVCLIYAIGYTIDLDFLLALLGGTDFPKGDHDLKVYLTQFMSYFFLTCITSFVISKVARNVVYKTGLYQKSSYLQMTNYWFELFGADYLERFGVPGRKSDTHFVVVDLLTDNEVIYSGLLVEYSIQSKSDQLEYLVLRVAKKKDFKGDGESVFRDIPGDVLVVPFSTVKNINVYHIHAKNEYSDSRPINHD